MNFNQVKILFVLRKNKTNNQGFCPLVFRITFNSKRREFNTGFYVPESDWNAKLQIVTSKTTYSKNINTHLNKMYRDLLATYSEVVLDNVDRTDKVNHSQRMKVSIVKYVLKIDSSEYKFNNYFLIFCA